MISFEDTKVAFGHKSDGELHVTHFLFSAMNFPLLTQLGVWSLSLFMKLKLPIKALIKNNLFKHFCGGETFEECEVSITNLSQSGIKSILDYSAEGEENEKGFDRNMEEVLRSLDFARANDDVSVVAVKLTGLVSFDILEKLQKGDRLSEIDMASYKSFKQRLYTICSLAVEAEKVLYIDAEESWIQESIDRVAYEMMRKFNRKRAYIFNTYQTYRKSALHELIQTHNLLSDEGVLLGAKIVRGAYMEKERKRAKEKGYSDPIQPSKEKCDQAFDLALKYCVDNLNSIALCSGTHNEKSSAYLIEILESCDVRNNDPRVCFAQLYGMSDHISYNLASHGFNVAKYLPYGPVEKVMPYLMRRAEENKSITGQSSRELSLLKTEMRRRGTQEK